MSSVQNREPVQGSDRAPIGGARAIGPVAGDERFEVTVRVRRRTPLQSVATRGFGEDVLPAKRQYLTRQEYEASHGADPADIARVEEFAGPWPGRGRIERRPAERLPVGYGSGLRCRLRDVDRELRARRRHVPRPDRLAHGPDRARGGRRRRLRDRRPSRRQATLPDAGRTRSDSRLAPPGSSFTPPQLATLYNFPTGVDGSGQCIAIIELGGGFRTADLTAYFQELGLPAPNVVAVRVDGGDERARPRPTAPTAR